MRRMSVTAVAVLQAIANGFEYGFDIIDSTNLPSGTVYPALRRLEEARLVRSAWEDHKVAQEAQRPPRKYYEMTGEGESALADAVKRYRMLDQGRAKARGVKPSKESA